jgi:hypothetical protein
MVNVLCASLQNPHSAASQIWESVDLRSRTTQVTSAQICDLLGLSPMNPNWSILPMNDKKPLIWMREVNRLIIDMRQALREMQER